MDKKTLEGQVRVEPMETKPVIEPEAEPTKPEQSASDSGTPAEAGYGWGV